MDIKNLIIDINNLGNNEVEVVKKKKAYKPKVEYKVDVQSGPDFSILRKTPKTEKRLVFLVSQGQYYIQDKKQIELLDKNNLRAFLSDAPDDGIVLEDVNWIDVIYKGVRSCERIFSLIKDNTITELMKKGLFQCSVLRDGSYQYYGYGENISKESSYSLSYIGIDQEDLYKMYKWFVRYCSNLWGLDTKATIRRLSERHGYGYYTRTFYGTLKVATVIMKQLGNDIAYSFIRNCVDIDLRYAEIGGYSGYRDERFVKILNDFNMKPSTMVEYMTFGMYHQGFADNSDGFIDTWYDDLIIQTQLYGKVKDKYPEYLETHHDHISFVKRRYQVQINKQNWELHKPEWKKYEWTSGDYIITSPDTPEDMYDEATQQSNCLAGYVDRVSNGETYIFFLRKKKTPDISLVTVELHPNLTVGQVYEKFNHQPSALELSVVNSWAKKFGFNMDRYKNRLEA